MNIGSMKEIFAIAHASGQAVKMVGPHGIGKSVIVSQFAKENGYHCEILQLPLMEEGDLMGIPTIEMKDGVQVTTWAKPIWVQRIDEATKAGIPTILFLDELGRASAGIRQVALQLTLENRLQEHCLGYVNGLPTLKVVADNPTDEYDTAEFDKALESRFMSFDVEASIDDWLAYARKVDILSVVTDYLAEYTENLHFQPESEGDKGSDPRSWEALSDILKNTPPASPLTVPIINSKIGKIVGANFYQYFRTYSKVVKVEDIMNIIGDSPITTEAEQRAVAKEIAKVSSELEINTCQELANKMLKAFKKGKHGVTAKAIVVYVASLNLEVTAGLLKNWKESKDADEKAFYFDDFQNATEKRWLLQELIKTVK